MKQKIKEALQQGYKNLGISEKAFEGVAAFATTFITDEAQIENFVKGAESMLKAFQSDADKLRSDYSQKIKDLESQLQKREPPKPEPPTSTPTPTPNEPTEIDKLIKVIQESNKQNNDLIASMKNEIAALKTEQAAKENLASASAAFKGNSWVKKYSEQADEAWERALEVYELGGSKMTSQELTDKAMGYFNKAVAKKGVDTSKPFEGNGGGDDKLDEDYFKSLYEKSGRIAAPKQE